jgi:ankyrin repeat protein
LTSGVAIRATQAAIDAFVAAVHIDGVSAQQLLQGDPQLSACRSSWGETGLQAASHVGRKGLIWRFVETGCQLDVFAACALGSLNAVVELYDRSRPDVCGVHKLPLLHFAVVSGSMDMVETLIAAGAGINPKDAALPPLHSAVASGNAQLVELLLLAGADRAARDTYGATALDWAVDLDGYNSPLAHSLIQSSQSPVEGATGGRRVNLVSTPE